MRGSCSAVQRFLECRILGASCTSIASQMKVCGTPIMRLSFSAIRLGVPDRLHDV
jgi:hypothetical protein